MKINNYPDGTSYVTIGNQTTLTQIRERVSKININN